MSIAKRGKLFGFPSLCLHRSSDCRFPLHMGLFTQSFTLHRPWPCLGPVTLVFTLGPPSQSEEVLGEQEITPLGRIRVYPPILSD